MLLAVTGSIAAYKSAMLVRLLVKEGVEVRVIMTNSSKDFITPLTLSTLSRNPVITDLFTEGSWSNHVMLGRWADLMLVAPLSCNTLAKMAHGLCDNMLLATYLSATCPVVVAPAMDEDMWKHPSTINNLIKIGAAGNFVIPVDNGELASGLSGPGRMAEPESIVKFISEHFFLKKDLEGKKVLVTAGPTYEPIDPVRFIGNHSSGKMGIALCAEFDRRGAHVTLVIGPYAHTIEEKKVKVMKVETAEQMFEACMKVFETADIAVMSAAVADYTPVDTATQKIKKNSDTLTIELKKTRDILKTMGERKRDDQLLAGFALETENEKDNARKKVAAKNADLIVLNSLNDKGAGFGHDTNKITIFDKKGGETEYDRKPKQQVAKDIVDSIVKLLHD
ncbi:MAG: bifunctional phosphopantothenoylcysteine decarboxylase/phosphopantothenate--cysteine ligase CoaBC [Chitinophagaceae bacterium]|nr:bifunctional phosphopantothenoylcysteine decarboxylase/phosphopantothenate--cysteine ligase CoaBC [Chitinophagaceae bacterium]